MGMWGPAMKCEPWAYGLVQIRMCSCAVLGPVGRLCSAVCTDSHQVQYSSAIHSLPPSQFFFTFYFYFLTLTF